ncbi:MAG TPA: glycosyltransferase family 87 protein, partial [Anaerolineales bacterium]|nr:glycosyltransferase family 87 protein [Anaerolineales bacterium]
MNLVTNLKSIQWGFVFQIFSILSLTIIYIFQWNTMIKNPSLRTGTDFMSYYSVARISQEYGISKVYDLNLQKEFQEEAVNFPLAEGQVLLYLHVPYIIPLLNLFVSKNYIVSFILWATLMLSIYSLASIFLLKNISKNTYGLYFLGLVLFFPFFQSLLLGQDTAILFLGVVFWFVGATKNKEWLSAIGVALTSVRPHFCLLFLASLFFYHPKSIWKYIFTTNILILLSFLLVGWNGIRQFIEILRISANGTWYGMNEDAMINLIGLLSRILPFISDETI